MPFQRFLNETIVIDHGGRTVSYEVSFQGKEIHGPFNMEVQEDDPLTRKSTGERFVVTSVERHQAPRAMSRLPAHCTLKVIYEAQARKREEAATHITQNIGSAHTVAGRDIHGGVNTTITVTQVFEALATAIDQDESIPEEEKATILGQIKSIASNPFVLAVAPPLLLEALKKQLGL